MIMSFENEYKNRSDTKAGFDAKLKRIENEGFAEYRTPTGYGKSQLGMDDLDRLRRQKLKTL